MHTVEIYIYQSDHILKLCYLATSFNSLHLFLFFNALTCFRYFSQFKKWWSLRSSCANWWKGWQGLFEVFNVRTHFVSAVHTPKSVLNRTCSKRGKNKEVAQSCRRVCLWCFYHILTSCVIYYCTDSRQNGIYLFYQKHMLLVLYSDQKRKKRQIHIRNLLPRTTWLFKDLC